MICSRVSMSEISCVKPLNDFDWFINKVFLLFAILDYYTLSSLNMLFKDWNVNSEESMIGYKSPI